MRPGPAIPPRQRVPSPLPPPLPPPTPQPVPQPAAIADAPPHPAIAPASPILLFDSGVGGLTVLAALRELLPEAPVIYAADNAGLPYGNKTEAQIAARVSGLLGRMAERLKPRLICIACNTASTIALSSVREVLEVPIVGTVPAIKVAAGQSKTRRFTLLATPNTAQSSYTQALVAEFASECVVDCYGAPELARYAESVLLGQSVSFEALRTELAPAFQDDAKGRTDTIVLGCTHYPLILDRLRAVVPWEVDWIDSGEAIARRALSFSPEEDIMSRSAAYVTSTADVARYREVFAREGFGIVRALTLG